MVMKANGGIDSSLKTINMEEEKARLPRLYSKTLKPKLIPPVTTRILQNTLIMGSSLGGLVSIMLH
jgi:hypothetical protein